MKLLVLHDKPHHEMGGMTRFIAAQNTLFGEAGWPVTEVICTPLPQPKALHVPPSGRRIGLRALRQLRELLSQQRPDVLLVHSVYYALSPLVLQTLPAHIPLVYVLHDVTPLCPRMTRLRRDGGICQRRQGLDCLTSACYQPGQQHGLLSDLHGLAMRAWQMRAAQAVRQWVVPSQYLKELLCTHGIASNRVAVIPHFVTHGEDGGAGGAGIKPTPASPSRLLFAGRLVPEKGIHCLLDALQHLHDIPWTLHIAGDGPEQARIQSTIDQRGWGQRVRCLGALDARALAQQYQQAAVVAMPSLIPESFGMVGLEAMHHRRPVVGFASGGMTEWLRHGVSGLVADWGDPQSLALALRQLIMQPQYASLLGQQGYALVLQEFSPERHLQGMQALLNTMAPS